jgi:hypothetical protein
MSFESLSYADLADRLGNTSEAARAGNECKMRFSVDLAESQHKPMPARSPAGHREALMP